MSGRKKVPTRYPEIEKYLDDRNMNLADFGELIGITGKQVYNILHHGCKTTDIIYKICEVTRLTYIQDEFGGDFVDYSTFLMNRLIDEEGNATHKLAIRLLNVESNANDLRNKLNDILDLVRTITAYSTLTYEERKDIYEKF